MMGFWYTWCVVYRIGGVGMGRREEEGGRGGEGEYIAAARNEVRR